MAEIKDKVTAQFYGDGAFQKQVIEALESAGVAVKVNQEKPYATKKGDTGTYRSLALTFAEDS